MLQVATAEAKRDSALPSLDSSWRYSLCSEPCTFTESSPGGGGAVRAQKGLPILGSARTEEWAFLSGGLGPSQLHHGLASASSPVKGGDSSLVDLQALLGRSDDPRTAIGQWCKCHEWCHCHKSLLVPGPEGMFSPHGISQTSIGFPGDRSVATQVPGVGC